jgi:acetyl esterase
MLAGLDPRLAELAATIMTEAGELPQLPSPAPRDGQSREDWAAEVAELRVAHDAVAALALKYHPSDASEVASIVDREIPVAGGTLTARVYTPQGEGPFPGIAYFHGGAWWFAGGETGFALNDAYCRSFAAHLGSVVVNVDYRLAPEHRYPGQLEDAFAALEWIVENADGLTVDATNVSVMGASSGANLAASVCLLARDRGGPALRSQILHVPALDLTLASPSIQADPLVAHFAALAELYATPAEMTDPHVSPMFAEDVGGLPSAVVITAEHDALRDDGRRYVDRLRAAGADVVWLEYPMLHSVSLPETRERMIGDVTAAVRKAQAGRPVSA